MITDSVELCRVLDARLGAFLVTDDRPATVVEVCLDPPPGRMTIDSHLFPLEPAAGVEQAFGVIFRHLLDRVGDYLLLHGAALSDGRNALLIAGPSGAGKTTLAMALLDQGLRLLGDDMAPLALADGLIHPFHKAPGIRQGAAADLAGQAPGPLNLEQLPAGRLEHRARPLGGVFFIGAARASADPTAPYFFVLTFSGPPRPEEIATFAALPGVRLAAEKGWEVVLRIDPQRCTTSAFEARLAEYQGRLLEYGTIASVDHGRPGPPRARPLAASRAMLLLAREVQNRRHDGALAQRAGDGGWLSCLASALKGVPCWAVETGAPAPTAALIEELFSKS